MQVSLETSTTQEPLSREEKYTTPVKKKRKQRTIALSGPTTVKDTSSAAKRLRIFEEITSPGDTAATVRDSETSQSESEDESSFRGKVPSRSFFEWNKEDKAKKASDIKQTKQSSASKVVNTASSSEDLLSLIDAGIKNSLEEEDKLDQNIKERGNDEDSQPFSLFTSDPFSEKKVDAGHYVSSVKPGRFAAKSRPTLITYAHLSHIMSRPGQ